MSSTLNLYTCTQFTHAHTSPGATIQFDAHADSSLVWTVRHQTYLTSYDWRTDVSHLSYKRVHVALHHLRSSTIVEMCPAVVFQSLVLQHVRLRIFLTLRYVTCVFHSTTDASTHSPMIVEVRVNRGTCSTQQVSKVKRTQQFVEITSRYGKSHAIWDHTVLPATRQQWFSSLYPSRSWYSI